MHPDCLHNPITSLDEDLTDKEPHATSGISRVQSPAKSSKKSPRKATLKRTPGESPMGKLPIAQVQAEVLGAGSPAVTAVLMGEDPLSLEAKRPGTPSSQAQPPVPITDPQLKAAAKQLIEKHTIENVQLENALQDKETSEINQLLSQFEDNKTKAIESAMVELEQKLTEVGIT